MTIFPSDILAGILILVSLILLLVAFMAYRRYRLKAAIISTVIFTIFLLKGIIYEANLYYSMNLNVPEIFMGLDVIILISLYFALALRG